MPLRAYEVNLIPFWVNAKNITNDFAKPWFRWNKDGSVAEDLDGQVTVCGGKIDRSDLKRFDRWLVGERFVGVTGGGAKVSVLQSFKSLDNPHSFVQDFVAKYQHWQPSFLLWTLRPQSHNVVARNPFRLLMPGSRSGLKGILFGKLRI